MKRWFLILTLLVMVETGHAIPFSMMPLGDLTQAAGAGWDEGYEDLNFAGWRRSPWLGDYVPLGNDWYFHYRHGYFFAFPGNKPDSIFFYTMDMGWLWTARNTYSYLYRFDPPGWIWYQPDSAEPRWFYNLGVGQWESW